MSEDKAATVDIGQTNYDKLEKQFQEVCMSPWLQ
jgi:hypothetical protein